MIVSKTPLHISFVGEGTDRPEFYRSESGATTGMAIDRYVYVMVNPRRDRRVRLRHARTETVESAEDLEHPIARAALRLVGIRHGIEISSVHDEPPAVGLGATASFAVGLLNALHAFTGRIVPAGELAAEACRIRPDGPGEAAGKQEVYLAAVGGMLHLRYHPDEAVAVERIPRPARLRARLREGLMLLYTGAARGAAAVLAEQAAAIRSGRVHPWLRKLRDLAMTFRNWLLREGSLAEAGALLHEGWQYKRKLAKSTTTREIDAHYTRALAAGALGGKLLGEGGGYLLLCCPPDRRTSVRAAVGLPELRFDWAAAGSAVFNLG
jgi:D-glycero-alpha-D-manno-heptose-7-phosphate kinase